MRIRVLLSVLVLLGSIPLFGEESEFKPVDCPQMMAWMAAGISSPRLIRLVKERGTAFSANEKDAAALTSAGASLELIHTLKSESRLVNNRQATTCPAELTQAARLVHQHNFEAAEEVLRKLIVADDKNPALHLALGFVRREQKDLDEAFDEYSTAKELEPGFPEAHNGLAYVFYASRDGDNAVAEARTALSIDPQNAEAHRYLGLGHYSNENYEAAQGAFEEAIARDPENADSYYDLGIADNAKNDPKAAVVAYRKAILLNPRFWEAHSNLGMALHEIGKLDQAIAEFRVAAKLAPTEAMIRNNLGNAYCDKGDFDAANAEFREVQRLDPLGQNSHSCVRDQKLLNVTQKATH